MQPWKMRFGYQTNRRQPVQHIRTIIQIKAHTFVLTIREMRQQRHSAMCQVIDNLRRRGC